jgi:hypothetical protein
MQVPSQVQYRLGGWSSSRPWPRYGLHNADTVNDLRFLAGKSTKFGGFLGHGAEKNIHSWSFLGRHLIWGNMITQGGTSGIILDFQGLLGWVSNQLGNGIKQIHHKLIGVNKLEEIRVDLLWLLNWTRSESVATQIPFTNFYTANNMLTPTFQMFS